MKLSQRLFVLGLALILPIGILLLAAYFTGGPTLVCQRVEANQIDCTLSERHWLGLVDAGGQSVPGLTGAHQEEYDCERLDSNDQTHTRRCFRLVLDTEHGAEQVALPTESWRDINAFVRDDTATILTMRDNRWLISAIASVLALIWLAAILRPTTLRAKVQPRR
ncbi:MAG: hypothetical protein KA765_01445 [Thermoflexales bacterium]|nr:hypothetical protein [Thermoflexales bacterium]